jgi:hypothetical protein
MTTLSADKQRNLVLGQVNEFPIIASEIIYEGAAVGIIKASGHAWPLVSPNKFAGFAEQKCDNSAGAAAAKNVRVVTKGTVQLSVSGAVITDVGATIYATDDDTFVFLPTGGVFIGFVKRFVSSGVVEVQFDSINYEDPWKDRLAETLATSALTLDIQDSGKVICCTVDTKVTLPTYTVELDVVVLNCGAYGAVKISIEGDGVELVQGPNISGTASKDLINTEATAQRGDYVRLKGGDTGGFVVVEMKGVWATEL